MPIEKSQEAPSFRQVMRAIIPVMGPVTLLGAIIGALLLGAFALAGWATAGSGLTAGILGMVAAGTAFVRGSLLTGSMQYTLPDPQSDDDSGTD